MVLAGMKESLAHGKVRNVLIELHNRDRKNELEDILSRNFTRTFWVDSQHIHGCRDKSEHSTE